MEVEVIFLKQFEVGSFMSNCYIIGCEETSEAAVIDPGAEPEAILSELGKNNLKLKYIINTHGHVDHIGANAEVKKSIEAPILIHKEDAGLLEDPQGNLSMYVGGKLTLPPAEQLLEEGDEISIGNIKLKVIHTPGHTQGGISLKADNEVFTGDSLFAGSIGRTDLPGGNHGQLIKSIKEKLLPLGDDVIVYPGHGPASSIGKEKKMNPFL